MRACGKSYSLIKAVKWEKIGKGFCFLLWTEKRSFSFHFLYLYNFMILKPFLCKYGSFSKVEREKKGKTSAVAVFAFCTHLPYMNLLAIKKKVSCPDFNSKARLEPLDWMAICVVA